MNSTGAVSTRDVDPVRQEESRNLESRMPGSATINDGSAAKVVVGLDAEGRMERLLGQLEVESRALAIYRNTNLERAESSKQNIGLFIWGIVAAC